MIRKRLRSALALAGVAFATVLLTAPQAKAITLTVTSLVKLGGDTGNYVQNNSANAGEWQSAISTLNAGGSKIDTLGQTISGATRYAAVLGSDSDALNFASRNDSATSNYRVAFTVSAPIGYTYDLKIDTRFIGALVNRNEGGAAGSESVTSNVTGTLNGVGNGGLTLATLTSQSSQNNTSTVNISKSNSFTLVGLTGTNNYQLDFTWSQSTSSGNNVLNGGDEAVVLLGLGTGISPTAGLIGAADDYPGTSGLTAANLGHFVDLTATITAVPEPSTLALAAIGLVGGAFAAWRRRR